MTQDAKASAGRAPGWRFGRPAAHNTRPMHSASFPDFLLLGVRHIFTGYDHLLFLLGLLAACARARDLALIVTSFTAGHSLTLAFATLGAVQMPARAAEPVIALSILWVGVENLLRKNSPPLAGRAAVTLLFGLVHGFGFATVLRDLGVGAEDRPAAMPLFAFNLGVEIGQLAFAAVVWPLLRRARSQPDLARRVPSAISVLVAIAGAYWLVERLLLG